MKKKVSATAFRLKGGGWYETDFKSGDKKNVVSDGKTKEKAKDDARPASTGTDKTAAKKKPSADSTKSKKVKN